MPSIRDVEKITLYENDVFTILFTHKYFVLQRNGRYLGYIFWRNDPTGIIDTGRGDIGPFVLTLGDTRPAFESVTFCTSCCGHNKESIFFSLLFQLKYVFRICFPPFLQFSNIAFDPFPGVITTNQ